MPFFEPSSDHESSDEESQQEEEDDAELACKEFTKRLEKVKKTKEAKPIKRVGELELVFYPAIQQPCLDELLYESLEATLKEKNFSNLNAYVKQFLHLFELLIKTDQNVGLKNFEDIQPKLKRRKMNECEDLKSVNFNFWMDERTSNKSLICQTTLLSALTTKSAIDAVNLERLEYIGDSFLKFVTCCVLFHNYQNASSVGELDILKNRIISNKNLYNISRRKQILKYVFGEKFLPGINFLPDGLYLILYLINDQLN